MRQIRWYHMNETESLLLSAIFDRHIVGMYVYDHEGD